MVRPWTKNLTQSDGLVYHVSKEARGGKTQAITLRYSQRVTLSVQKPKMALLSDLSKIVYY